MEERQWTKVPNLQSRIAQTAGKSIIDLQPLQGRGYTPALRLIATFADGSTAFVKVATNAMMADWLRREQHVYRHLRGNFMPRTLGWDDDGEQPLLLLEDLRHAHWPPPWTPAHVDAVLAALDTISVCNVPGLEAINGDGHVSDGWQRVATDPVPFLSLGMATAAWLERALPVLLAVDGARALVGDALLHFDVRSDNICLIEGRAVLVDWNWTCRGNPQVDVASWLPSLHAEGGPPPEAILPDAPELATVMSGFFAARAGLPPIPDAPRVRHIQNVQLRTALPWVARALQLPPPDGPDLV